MAINDLTEKDSGLCLENAQNKALQLHAMLTTITGAGGDSLRAHNLAIQDNYLWACADIAEELCNLIEQANSRSLQFKGKDVQA